MYATDETVLYGSNGLCRIASITKRDNHGEVKEYYALKPLNTENTTIFVPVESKELVSKMKRMISSDEIRRVFKTIPVLDEEQFSDERQRLARYREILDGGDIKELILLIRTLFLHQRTQVESGKKLRLTDERFFKDAQKLLQEEIAHILNLSEEQAVQFIVRELEDGENITQ